MPSCKGEHNIDSKICNQKNILIPKSKTEALK